MKTRKMKKRIKEKKHRRKKDGEGKLGTKAEKKNERKTKR